jgi:hypothetical protein
VNAIAMHAHLNSVIDDRFEGRSHNVRVI